MDKPIPEAVAQLRRLADVIRKHGTIPSLSLEHIADALTAAQQSGQAAAWTEAILRDEAKRRGWHVREGTSVPTVDGDWRHPFSVTAESRDLLELLNAQPMQQGGGEVLWLRAQDAADIREGHHVSGAFAEFSLAQDDEFTVPFRTAPPSAPVGVEALVAKWDRKAAEHNRGMQSVDAALSVLAAEVVADLRSLAQQPAAIPRLANCGRYTATDNTGQHYYLNHANTWRAFQGQQPAAVDEAMVERAYRAWWKAAVACEGNKTAIRAALTAALSQQPEARGVVDGEVTFNAAFFVSRSGNRIEQMTTYDDYRRDGALLALMDLGQKRASARGLTKKNAGKVTLAWVTAPQIVECDAALTGERNE